jgi:hypothetical protein
VDADRGFVDEFHEKSGDSGFGIRDSGRAYKLVVPAKAGTHFDLPARKQNGFRLSPE